jgi:hypothetical protein
MRHKFINDFNKHSTINRLDFSKGQYCDGSIERNVFALLEGQIIFCIVIYIILFKF